MRAAGYGQVKSKVQIPSGKKHNGTQRGGRKRNHKEHGDIDVNRGDELTNED